MNYEQAIEYFEKLRNTSAFEIILESLYWALGTALALLLILFILTFLALCPLLVRSIIKKELTHIELGADIEIGFNINYIKSFFCVFTKDSELIKTFGLGALGCFFIVFVSALIRKQSIYRYPNVILLIHHITRH